MGDREADVVGEAFLAVAVDLGFGDFVEEVVDEVVAQFGEAVAFGFDF